MISARRRNALSRLNGQRKKIVQQSWMDRNVRRYHKHKDSCENIATDISLEQDVEAPSVANWMRN